jgi:hypothetical protein
VNLLRVPFFIVLPPDPSPSQAILHALYLQNSLDRDCDRENRPFDEQKVDALNEIKIPK